MFHYQGGQPLHREAVEEAFLQAEEEEEDEPPLSQAKPRAATQPTPQTPHPLPAKLDLPPTVGKGVTKADLECEATEKDIEKFLEEGEKEIPITDLLWDKDCQHGQSRKLDPDKVQALVDSMNRRKPLAPLRVLVYDKGSMWLPPTVPWMSPPVSPHRQQLCAPGRAALQCSSVADLSSPA